MDALIECVCELQAYKDLLKNKDIIDFYGEEPPPEDRSGKDDSKSDSLSSFSLATLGLSGAFGSVAAKSNKSNSKDNLYNTQEDDEALLDENLLQDLA